MPSRKGVPRLRVSSLGNKPIRYATTMKCNAGHEFGLDIEKLNKFYRQPPSTVRCPYPRCSERVPVKVKEDPK